MPRLTPRQEKFCREYVRCGVAARAYLAAGYTASTRNALDASSSRALGYAKIKRRIEGLRQAMAKKHNVTLDTLADELDEARALALAATQPGAAVQATTVKAKLFGHLVDRKEVGKPGDFQDAESAADVLERVRKELGEHAAAALAGAIGSDETPEPARDATPTHETPDSVN